ncbi:MAG TPA: hypothetical protein VF021_04740 [Longimicrobiales bacterium]
MSSRKKSKLTAEKRRELQVCAAVARETLLQTHVARALKLIELANNRVSVMRMLAIYARLHDLSDADGEVFSNRVLALLGHRARKGQAPLVYVEGEDEQPSSGRSVVRAVRDRLRGRRLHDLRRWIELHTGSTQAALIEVHVRHALRFVAELKDTHSIAEALKVYDELVEVPSNMTDALYIFTLDRLAIEELPRQQVRAVVDAEQVPLFPQQRRNKRHAV